jgi:hypothetical protein
LTENDFTLEISGSRSAGYDFTFTVEETDAGMIYAINISFTHEDIPNGTSVSIIFAPYLVDVDGNGIENQTVTA